MTRINVLEALDQSTVEVKNPSKWAVLWKIFRKNKMAMLSLIFIFGISLSCLLAPLIAPYHPNEGELVNRLLPLGSEGHILGTDEQGRDILSRILYGGRLSLISGLIPIIIASLIGGGLGVVAGYMGGKLNAIIMRTLDVFYSFPIILLAIGIAAALGPGLTNIMISATIVFIPPIARIAETAVKEVRKEEYIEAAVSSGASTGLIIRKAILPNVSNRLFVYCSSQVAICLIVASGLSFLGLGVSPPTAEWGFMLNNLKQIMFINPILTIIPGVFIFLTSLAFNIVSEGIADALETAEGAK